MADGQFGPWSNFSSCSVTCGNGQRIRFRELSFLRNGNNNTGHGTFTLFRDKDIERCNEMECPIAGYCLAYKDYIFQK